MNFCFYEGNEEITFASPQSVITQLLNDKPVIVENTLYYYERIKIDKQSVYIYVRKE